MIEKLADYIESATGIVLAQQEKVVNGIVANRTIHATSKPVPDEVA